MKLCTALVVLLAAGCAPAPAPAMGDEVMHVGPRVGDYGEAPREPAPGEGERQPYPIVLAHGLVGFDNIGPIHYFHGVAEALRADGHTVFTPQVDPYNSSDVRGEQLLAAVEQVLAETGAKKVKLICHSQGGLDCRYVASKIGDRVSAIVTISTPHRGTPIADIAVGTLPGPMQKAFEAIMEALGVAISGHPNMDAQAALHVLTAGGSEDFGRRHPDHPLTRYYSIAGRSDGATGEDTCGTPTEAPFVARWNAYRDPVDPVLKIPAEILARDVHPTPSSDGLVPVASSRYGVFLGCIPADHLDEVCQIANDRAGPGNPFDCHLFYRQLASWLVTQGH